MAAIGNIKFDFGDTLPSRFDTAIAIFDKSKKDGKSRESVVNLYVSALRRHWIKAFGEKLLISIQAIKPKVTEILKSYNTNVYIPHTRKTKSKQNK